MDDQFQPHKTFEGVLEMVFPRGHTELGPDRLEFGPPLTPAELRKANMPLLSLPELRRVLAMLQALMLALARVVALLLKLRALLRQRAADWAIGEV